MNQRNRRHSLSRLFTVVLLVLTAAVVVQTAGVGQVLTPDVATTFFPQGE